MKKLRSTITTIASAFSHMLYTNTIHLLDIKRYAQHPTLLKINLTLWMFYKTYYSASKHTYEKNQTGKNPIELTYGETSFHGFQKILDIIKYQPKKTDRFYDLGSGRGKLVFYMAETHKIHATGIDIIPTFCDIASKLAKRYKISNARFIQGDFCYLSIEDASLIYLAGTTLNPDTISALLKNMESLKKGCIIISSSMPLKSPFLKPIKKLSIPYSWGTGTVYIQEKR